MWEMNCGSAQIIIPHRQQYQFKIWSFKISYHDSVCVYYSINGYHVKESNKTNAFIPTLGTITISSTDRDTSYLFNCPDPSEKLWLTFPYRLLPLLLLPPLLMLCNGILQLNSKTKPNGTFHLTPTHTVSYHITKLLKICHIELKLCSICPNIQIILKVLANFNCSFQRLWKGHSSYHLKKLHSSIYQFIEVYKNLL